MIPEAPHLVALSQPQQSAGKPFFCFPAGASTPLSLYLLAHHLAPARPVYSCLYDGVENDQEPQHTVEDIASVLEPELRQVQPVGPYYLGGFCMGGLVALELGQRLQQAGERVAVAVMLDTIPPLAGAEPGQGGSPETSAPDPDDQEIIDQYVKLIYTMDQSMEDKLSTMSYEAATRIRKARDHHNLAGAIYRSPCSAVPVAVIHTGLHARQVYARWASFTSAEFTQTTVSGDTLSMLVAPVVETVAQKLGEVLERARPGEPES